MRSLDKFGGAAAGSPDDMAQALSRPGLARSIMA